MSTAAEVFAAERTARMEKYDGYLLPIVSKALKSYDPDKAWYDPIVKEAARLYEVVSSYPAPASFTKRVREIVAKTGDPDETFGDSDERVTKWVSTYTVNAATYASGDSGDQKQWITKRDERVRESHVVLDGRTIPSGEKFRVGEVQMRYPGEPVGDPHNWINCRCVLRVLKGADMANENLVADVGPHRDAENEPPVIEPEDMPAENPDDTKVDDEAEVPFHGVAAPTDKPTGDRRQLSREGFSKRPLPLPLFYQRAQGEGHGGSTVVGQLTRLEINEAGEVEYDGKFNFTPEAAEAIQGVAEGWLRGVSVDLDDVMVDYSRAGQAMDEDIDIADAMDAAQSEVTVFKSWRVAGLTMVGIPAFHEAYLALGTRAEAEAKKKRAATPQGEAPAEDAPPVPPAKKKDPAAPSGDKEVQPSENRDSAPPFPKKKAPAKKADGETETFAPGTHDGPGWITAPVPTGRIRRYWTQGEGAAKIKWGVPGDFNRCRTQIAKYIANPEWLAGTCANMHKEATGVWPGRESGAHAGEIEALVAAGGLMAEPFNLIAAGTRENLPPSSYFQDPLLAGPTPITIEGERVFGHVATWGTCHIGFGGTCTEAPHSDTNYSWFRLGAVETREGLVPVGQITLGTGHADLRANPTAAAAHYDNTGSAIADIAVGEDTHGIWFSGRIRPGVSDEDRAALLAAKLSGDWRRIGGNLELVAALAVNTPGFGIPRLGLVASAAGQTSLVAAGIVEVAEESDEDRMRRIAREMAREMIKRHDEVAALRARTQALRSSVHALRLAQVAALRAKLGK